MKVFSLEKFREWLKENRGINYFDKHYSLGGWPYEFDGKSISEMADHFHICLDEWTVEVSTPEHLHTISNSQLQAVLSAEPPTEYTAAAKLAFEAGKVAVLGKLNITEVRLSD